MKTKFLYIISGFLAMTMLCAMLVAPEWYFQHDNWQEESENVIIDSQTEDVSISEKLKMLYCTTMTNGDSSLREAYRYSKTFIPSGKELAREDLEKVMGWEFSKIGSIFYGNSKELAYDDYFFNPFASDSPELYISHISTLLTRFPEESIINASMCQIVSLEESTRGFVVWQVEFQTKLKSEGVSIHGYVDMDAVSGRFLSWNLRLTFDDYPPYAPFFSGADMDLYYEDMMKTYYDFAQIYWKMNLKPENTSYLIGNGEWMCYDYTSHLAATMTMQKTVYFDNNLGMEQTSYFWTSKAYPFEDKEDDA